MSLKFAGDVCVKAGNYQDNQGNNKNRYLKIGAYFQDSDSGNVGILLQAVPLNLNVGKEGGCWLSLFPKRDENVQAHKPQNQSSQNANDEAVPF